MQGFRPRGSIIDGRREAMMQVAGRIQSGHLVAVPSSPPMTSNETSDEHVDCLDERILSESLVSIFVVVSIYLFIVPSFSGKTRNKMKIPVTQNDY